MKKILYSIAAILITCGLVWAATTTTNYSLTKPGIGDVDWGASVNTNFDTIDTTMKANEDAAGLNTTHRSSNGSDHSYIDQDVTSGSTPTFTGTNITAAATATALVTNPTACSSGDYVSDLDADGTLTCSTPAGGAGGNVAVQTDGTQLTAALDTLNFGGDFTTLETITDLITLAINTNANLTWSGTNSWSGTSTFSGATSFTGAGSFVIFDEGSSESTPGSNKVKLYAKSDGFLYSKDDTGIESNVGGATLLTGLSDIASSVTYNPGLILIANGTQFDSVTIVGDGTIAAGGTLTIVDNSHNHTESNITDLNPLSGLPFDKSIVIESPVTLDSWDIFSSRSAVTLDRIDGTLQSSGTIIFDFFVNDSAVNGSFITLTNAGTFDSSLGGTTSLTTGDVLSVQISTVSGDVTWAMPQISGSYD